MSQSPVVNVSVSVADTPLRVRSVSAWPVTVTVTVSVGSVASSTVYAAPPLSPSATVSDAGASTMPRSLSATVTSFTSTNRVALALSYPPPSAVWISLVISSIESSSSLAVTVTVWGASQLAVVKVNLALSSRRSLPACPLIVTMTGDDGWNGSLTV